VEGHYANFRFRQAEINRTLKTPEISRGKGFSKGDFDMFRAAVQLRPAGAGAPEQEPELTGIIFSPTKKLAVIRGEFYRQGDVYKGKRILEILEDRIVLQDGDREITLKLGG